MLINPDKLIDDFIDSFNRHSNIRIQRVIISHNLLEAPHMPLSLPKGKCAVYVFSLTANSRYLAGPNRVLKVGKVGAKSAPRFQYQHYKRGSANSTLAGAIESNKILWDYIGIEHNITDFGEWLKNNTDRDHFFVDGQHYDIASRLEIYLKGVLGPVFEGSNKS